MSDNEYIKELFERAKPLEILESVTGADFLITKSAWIPTAKTLPILCKSGILIQRKSGNDLISSIPELARIGTKMLSLPCENNLLLYSGRFTNDNGKVRVNSRTSGWDYWTMMSALSNWGRCFGNVVNVKDDIELAEYILWVADNDLDKLLKKEKRIIHNSKKEYEIIKEDTPQDTLGIFPKGISHTLANALWDRLVELNKGEQVTPIEYLTFATWPEMVKAIGVKGWGKKTSEKVRDYWGIGEGKIITEFNPGGSIVDTLVSLNGVHPKSEIYSSCGVFNFSLSFVVKTLYQLKLEKKLGKGGIEKHLVKNKETNKPYLNIYGMLDTLIETCYKKGITPEQIFQLIEDGQFEDDDLNTFLFIPMCLWENNQELMNRYFQKIDRKIEEAEQNGWIEV